MIIILQVYTINFLLSVLSAIPWKHHSFIACGIVYSCYALVNNTGNELVIFPGIALKTDNKTILSYTYVTVMYRSQWESAVGKRS